MLRHKDSFSSLLLIIKRVLLLFLPLFILVASLIFFKYSAQKEQVLSMIENMQSQYLLKEEEGINYIIYEIISDLYFMADLELTASFLSDPSRQAEMEKFLVSFARSQKIYENIQIHSFGEFPDLIVQHTEDNEWAAISARNRGSEEKRDRSNEVEYLVKGEVLISPVGFAEKVSIRKESDEPGLRFSTPVTGSSGKALGAVSFKYSEKSLFEHIRTESGIYQSKVALLDSRNNILGNFPGFLRGPVFLDRDELLTLKKEDPQAWERISSSPEDQFYSEGGLYTYVYVYPLLDRIARGSENGKILAFRGEGSPPWKLLKFVPSSIIEQNLKPMLVSNQVQLLSLSIVILLFCLGFADIYEKRKKQALVDPLTSLWNRRFFLEKMNKIQGELKKDNSRACLAIIDLGNFKDINDNLGHHTGDMVLASAAAIIRENVRINDDAARYGGDEFILFFPRTGYYEAGRILERICRKIRQVELPIDNYILEADFGIGEYPSDSLSMMDIIEIADSRMYKKKKLRKGNSERGYIARQDQYEMD